MADENKAVLRYEWLMGKTTDGGKYANSVIGAESDTVLDLTVYRFGTGEAAGPLPPDPPPDEPLIVG